MSIYQIVITCVFAVMTVLGFVVMGIDKAKAKEGKWRIKEAALLRLQFCSAEWERRLECAFSVTRRNIGILRYFSLFSPLSILRFMP